MTLRLLSIGETAIRGQEDRPRASSSSGKWRRDDGIGRYRYSVSAEKFGFGAQAGHGSGLGLP